MWSVWAQLKQSAEEDTRNMSANASAPNKRLKDRKTSTSAVYIDAMLKECTSSLLLFLIFNPIQVYINPYLYIIYFFFGIIFFDWVTKGACANPAVTIAQCIDGTIDAYECLAHFGGYILAAHMAYPLLTFFQPVETIVGPLQLHLVEAHPMHIFKKEFVSTLVLILAVEAVPYFTNEWTGRSFISIAIRCISNYAGKYAAFNPLVPLCWVIFSNQTHKVTDTYFVVYFIAPIMGEDGYNVHPPVPPQG